MIKKITFSCALLLLTGIAFAQRPTTPQDTTKNSQVIIDYADTLDYFKTNGDIIQKMMGQVELRQDSIFMYCDSATITNNTQVVAKGNVVIQQGDSLNIFADSLNYDADAKEANLYSDVVLENGEQQLFTDRLDYDMTTKIATYQEGALLTNGATQLTSKRGYYHTASDEIFFKDSVVVIDPEFDLRADTLKMNTTSRIVTFLSPTLIRSDSVQIYCEDGFYNIADSLAEFRQNAQLVKGDQQAQADIIRYEGKTDSYILSGNALFIENDRQATADKIKYDAKTEETILIGNARYRDATQNITAEEIIYDSKNEIYKTRGRSLIEDEEQLLEADQVDYDKNTGLGIASGNVVWRDTSADLTIRSEHAIYDQDADFFKASGGRPLLITVVDGDTLFMASDTLMAVSEIDTLSQDTARVLIANKRVKIFKSDLQVVCDSLIYNTTDSTFRFFKNPIIWSDTSQFQADTIHLTLKDEQIHRIFLHQHSLIINSPDQVYYNQIKGKHITANFEEGNLRQMEVEGNAESVYYAQDSDKAYIGVNKVICSDMRLYFGDNAIRSIKFYTEPNGKLNPMDKVDHDAIQLEGVQWQEDIRPKSVADLLKIQQEILLPKKTDIKKRDNN